MGTEPCLFFRARSGKQTPKKVCAFTALPGEIRNIVYDHYFEPKFRCEFAAKGCQFKEPENRTVKLWSGLTNSDGKKFKYDAKVEPEHLISIRIARPLGKYNVVKGLQTNWLASIYALSLVCKQVYAETVTFLYEKTTFFFDSPKRINNFLNVVSKPKLEQITKLQLHYITYRDPKSYHDRKWQEKHHNSWTRACKTAAKELSGLRELEVWVHTHDSAPQFNLREKWVAPMLQFRRLTYSSKSTDAPNLSSQSRTTLNVVNIQIRTRWSKEPLAVFNNNRSLAKACTDLHVLFGKAISLAIMGAKEAEAMIEFDDAWKGRYSVWRFHLQFAETGW